MVPSRFWSSRERLRFFLPTSPQPGPKRNGTIRFFLTRLMHGAVKDDWTGKPQSGSISPDPRARYRPRRISHNEFRQKFYLSLVEWHIILKRWIKRLTKQYAYKSWDLNYCVTKQSKYVVVNVFNGWILKIFFSQTMEAMYWGKMHRQMVERGIQNLVSKRGQHDRYCIIFV